MNTSVIFRLKCLSKTVHYPLEITHTFFSLETFTGRSSDHTAPARWWNECAPWVSLSALCQREASSHCLVAQDTLHFVDIRNCPRGAPPLLWLTAQLGKPVLSHNSPDALCSLWSHGFLLILASQDAQCCVSVTVSPFFLASLQFRWKFVHL